MRAAPSTVAVALVVGQLATTSAFSSSTPPLLARAGWRGRHAAGAPLHELAAERTTIAEFSERDFPSFEWPYTDLDMGRQDESPDTYFYDYPKLVTHIDDAAIASLTRYYAKILTPDAAVLDICSSWVSHLPPDGTVKLGQVVGLGMNEEELARNKQLTSYDVRDLNVDPKLPYDDNTFDFVFNVVSVDYLNKPLEIFTEMHRVLKPGGTAVMSFSNRMFASKAVKIWLESDDFSRMKIVGSYFFYSNPTGWTDITALDLAGGANNALGGLTSGLPSGLRRVALGFVAAAQLSDPMYAVQATKK